MPRALVPIVIAASLLLPGCVAGLPMALSAAAGALTVAKDVFDIDVSLRQDKPDKTPLDKALLPMLVIPRP